jgi:ribonuclease P protein component
MSFRFPKSERIVSQKLIDKLFCKTGSHSMVAFPVRVVYRSDEAAQQPAPNTQVLISVPKRKLRHAVDRNRVKRQIREAYRLNKDLIGNDASSGMALSIAFVWLSDRVETSEIVASRIKALLKRISDRTKG